MRKDALQRGLPAPDEAYARHYYLHQGVEAPDLATIKDSPRKSDSRVFREYVANYSSVTGIRAFLDEEADIREVEYFQGLEQFREQGLPYQLPAAERDKHQDDSVLGELQQNLRTLRLQDAPASAINEAKISYPRTAWPSSVKLFANIRSNRSRMMASEEPLSLADNRQAIRDIYSLITRDFTENGDLAPGIEFVGTLENSL